MSEIIIRGQTFPSEAAAAAALGVKVVYLRGLVRSGQPLDAVGLRAARAREIEALCPFKVRRRVFKSFAACARHFGLDERSVRQAVIAGRADRIGLHSSRTRSRSGPEPLPVRIRGTVYPSVDAAAKALRLSPATVRNAILKGREDFIGLGTSRAHRNNTSYGGGPRKRPVRIGTMQWDSILEAAGALGVSWTTLAKRLAQGDTDWLVAKAMQLEARTLQRRQKELAREAA